MNSQNAKDLTRQRFGKYAQGYVNSQAFASAPELARLVTLTNPQPHWYVLDVATGGGHTALTFLPYVHRVIASDLTEIMLASARNYARQANGELESHLTFNVADAESLPYAQGSFHLVTCRIAAHHFPDPGQFMRQAYRVLQPGGIVAVQDLLMPPVAQAAEYINSEEYLRDPSHQRAFSQPEWEALFSTAGFQVMHVETAVLKHPFLQWVERQGCSAQVTAQLTDMFRTAPPAVQSWRQLTGFDGDLAQAVFYDPHILAIGRKKKIR